MSAAFAPQPSLEESADDNRSTPMQPWLRDAHALVVAEDAARVEAMSVDAETCRTCGGSGELEEYTDVDVSRVYPCECQDIDEPDPDDRWDSRCDADDSGFDGVSDERF